MRLMKQRLAFLNLIMPILLSSCGVRAPTLSTPTATLTCTPTQTRAPSPTSPPTITLTPTPLSTEYNPRFLSALPSAAESCLPNKTQNDLGIYIYDLNRNQELISINVDTPFQFASAFKGPVLVYFLSQCKKYWDTQSPEWNAYFENPANARDVAYYSSVEYKALLVEPLSNVGAWDNIESFFDANRFVENGVPRGIDDRYFILSKVYSMTTRSNNRAAGEVLQFVFENCQPQSGAEIFSASDCYQPNAVSQFNLWFDKFSGIEYPLSQARRGLFKWDVVIEKDASGNPYESKMATYGLEDACVTQTAQLSCSESAGANAWTAKDFFKFYNTLYRLVDSRIRNAALGMLMIDNASPARGNLKNLARKMGAVSMSKNGHAYFIHGSINTDAGIFYYQNTPFIIIVLGYDAQSSLSLLYGDYNSAGDPLTDPSMIQDLLEEYIERQ